MQLEWSVATPALTATRSFMPGPFLSTVLLGGAAIAEAGSPAQRRHWLPEISAGNAKAALAWTEPNLRWDAAGIMLRAREAGGGYTLSGVKLFVGDAHLADIIAVAARTRHGSTMEDGVSLFLMPRDTPGLTINVLPTIDETRKLCEVRLDNAAAPAGAVLGEIHQGWAPLSRVIARATGSTTTRRRTPQWPSLQTTLLPMMNCSLSLIAHPPIS